MRNKVIANKKWILLALFLLTVVAGAGYPVSKIVRFEMPSAPPAVYRFEAGIVDPYDPFRGRYVTLSPMPTEVVLDDDEDYQYEDDVYAVLANDARGFAQIVGLTKKLPAGGDAVRVNVYWRTAVRDKDDEETGKNKYRIALPFTRFYMNEKLAPEAEEAVQEAMWENDGRCAIVVAVYKDGNYAVRDLELDGVPIREYLKEYIKNKAEED